MYFHLPIFFTYTHFAVRSCRMHEQKTVLVIDDQEIICSVTRDILEDECNYRVVTYTELPSIDCIVVHAPDLILLDILLGQGDGRKFCADIRHDPRICEIAILLFSVYNVDPLEIEACGADGFIRKPFDMDDFISTIQTYIEHRMLSEINTELFC